MIIAIILTTPTTDSSSKLEATTSKKKEGNKKLLFSFFLLEFLTYLFIVEFHSLTLLSYYFYILYLDLLCYFIFKFTLTMSSTLTPGEMAQYIRT